jgi:sugar phosphate permease
MSFAAMSVFGMLPLGSLLTGFISGHIGAPNTLLCQGIISLVIAIAFYRFLRKDKDQLNKKGIEQLEEAEGEMIKRI